MNSDSLEQAHIRKYCLLHKCLQHPFPCLKGEKYSSRGIPCFIRLCFIVLHRYCIFHKLKACGNLELSKSCQYHFSNHVYSCHVSVSRFGNSPYISNFSFIIIFAMMICNQWPLILSLQKKLQFAQGSDDDYNFLAMRFFFLLKVSICFVKLIFIGI